MRNKLRITIVLSSAMLLYCLLTQCGFGIVLMIGATISSMMTYQSYMGK